MRLGRRHSLLALLAVLLMLVSSGVVGVVVPPAAASPVAPILLPPPDGIYVGNNFAVAFDGDLVAGRVETPGGWDERAVAWDLATEPPTSILLPSLGPMGTTYMDGAVAVSGSHVVGSSVRSEGWRRAVVWDMTTSPPTPTDLGTLGGEESAAEAIDGTTVVGSAFTGTPAVHAVAWDLTTVPPRIIDLGTLTTGFADGGLSHAVAVNGDIVAGYSRGADGLDHAVAWDLRTTPPTMTDLGSIGARNTYAQDVDGTIVVAVNSGEWFDEAFAYDLAAPGQVPLGPVAGDSLADRRAAAVSGRTAVGSSGVRVFTGSGYTTHAAAWDLRTSPPAPVDLGTFGGATLTSRANDVDGYFVVGAADLAASFWHAALWDLTVSPPAIIDLGSLGRTSEALAVQGNRAVGIANVMTADGDVPRAVAWDLPNSAPVANGDAYTTGANQELTVSTSDGILANDVDANGDSLSVSVARDVTHGSLTLHSDGSFVHTPDVGYVGSDWFSYTVTDGAASDIATVALTVTPAALAPAVASGSMIGIPSSATTMPPYSFRFDDVVSEPQTGGRFSWRYANGKVTLSARVVGGVDHYIAFAPGAADVCALDASDPSHAYDNVVDIAPDDPTDGFVLIRTNTAPAYYIAVHVDDIRSTDGVPTSLDAIWYLQTDGTGTFCTTANAPPVASDDSYEAAEDTVLSVPVLTGVLANDTDVDSATLTAALGTDVTHGSLTLHSDGSFTYTPDADFYGTDTFTYTVSDGTATDTATVTITVTPVNDPPIAVDDSYEVAEDTVLTVPVLTGVLANDTDVDSATLTAALGTDVTRGSLTLNGDGSFTYTPDADFYGTDTFIYTVSDGTATDTATVTITVTPVNDPPIAVDDSYEVAEDTVLTVPVLTGVLANDTDVDSATLTAALGTDVTRGSLTLHSDGSFIYTPDADFYGTDTFTYTVSDSTATVTITVTAVNDPPVAVDDDGYSTAEDTALVIAPTELLANDSDVDGDVLSITDLDDPVNGTVQRLPSGPDAGKIQFLPAPNFSGTASFAYTVSDGTATDTATVTITVTAVNDPPVVRMEPTSSRTVQYSDQVAPITVTATDIDSTAVVITVDDLPSALNLTGQVCDPVGSGTTCTAQIHGTVTIAAGTHAFSAHANDGHARSDVVSGSIVVTAESASVTFDTDNPISVRVDTGKAHASAISLEATVVETDPDLAIGMPAAGDLAHANVAMTLLPVGPGTPIAGSCGGSTTGAGYDQVRTVICAFAEVPVDTYTVELAVTGGYYTGIGEDVLTVYDPNAGFATGGGWFAWPETGDRTNFGFTMKYNKKGTSIQGTLLMIRHLPDGSIYRVKSNALYGLTVGTATDDGEIFGWASFSGKSTYLEPGWLQSIGNQEFVVGVTDRNEPGTGVDTFEIRMLDHPALSLADPEEILGGNIVVPHDGRSPQGGGGRKK
jgi:VCBS repeat-containing protein